MNQEQAFLDALRSNPADNNTRLVYADWLEERAGPEDLRKSEFLRQTAGLDRTESDNETLGELQHMAATMDTDWLAVATRMGDEETRNGLH